MFIDVVFDVVFVVGCLLIRDGIGQLEQKHIPRSCLLTLRFFDFSKIHEMSTVDTGAPSFA